jgi:hypothetical protein
VIYPPPAASYPTTSPASPLQAQLDDLSRAVERLSGELDNLTAALTPVLLDPPPRIAADTMSRDSVPVPNMANRTHTIFVQRVRVDDANERLADLRNRLEV